MAKTTLIKYTFLLLVCLPFHAMADICFKTFEEDTTAAKAIFVGKVVKIEESEFWFRGPKTIFTFEINESFKGLWKGLSYISIVGPLKGCCNEHFVKDSTFLVFAYGDGERPTLLWTNDCSNTGLLSGQREIYQKLGMGKKHESNPDFLKIINEPVERQDSLLKKIKELSFQIDTIQKDKNWLRILSIILFTPSVALLIVIIFKKKR